LPYDNLIQRGDVAALVPEEISNQMLTNLESASAALALGTRLNVPTSRLRFPVLSALPVAYWVDGDTGMKQTATAAWDRKFIEIRELAVIVPLPDGVQEDTDFDIWGNIQPAMESAIARALDAAIFFGDNKPSVMPPDLSTGAVAAGNVVAMGTNDADNGALAGDISDLIATLEDDGYIPDGGIAEKTLRGAVRKLNVGPITVRPGAVLTPDNWYGFDITYPDRGLWPAPGASVTRALVGDFKENLVVGVRSDFTYKLFTEGVITDDNGNVIFNLMQQDMSALRLTFRAGFQISNPINYDQPIEADRFPFAVLQSAAA
jgi:HK97 family phage major capsid protein